MKESTALRKIAELFKSTHWIQGAYNRRKDNKMCYCLVGAIMKQTGQYGMGDPDFDLHNKLIRRLSELIKKPDIDIYSRGDNLIRWNDRKCRRVDHVVALVEKAAAQAEAEGM